jgi:hypothetical protein
LLMSMFAFIGRLLTRLIDVHQYVYANHEIAWTTGVSKKWTRRLPACDASRWFRRSRFPVTTANGPNDFAFFCAIT